jgi:hypothetical protein
MEGDGDDDEEEDLEVGEALTLNQVLQARQEAAERAGLVMDLA